MVIGRAKEIQELKHYLGTERADLLLITGRRRIGKTYLIQETYGEQIVFQFTGTKDESTASQLEKFSIKISEYSKSKMNFNAPKSWFEAFNILKTFLQNLRKTKSKRVVFFDELPWINQPKSSFLNEFSYWWNDWAAKQNILVVICGSSTAWMVRKIIQDRGGLHNRLTGRIHLEPFSLSETRDFLHATNKNYSDYDILHIYMCMGGIPHYLNQIRKGESPTQAIHRICFTKTGLLYNEFNEVFASLFDNYTDHASIVRALASKWKGLTRAEILNQTKLTDGGGFNRTLKELEASSFIMNLPPLFNKKKGTIYRLSDEYSRFYIHFIDGQQYSVKNWLAFQTSSKIYTAWQGYAFENICIKHAESIKICLGIHGIESSVNSFYAPSNKNNPGLQIDMLIDRADNVINICEIKFYNKTLRVDVDFSEKIRIKSTLFKELTKSKKSIFNTLITTYGVDTSAYNSGEIQNYIDMSCLFKQEELSQ